ncbi:MAG: tRNA pseudouridine synthase A, partial [Bacteroidota bacterium]
QGHRYHGWQRQPQVESVQAMLETQLSKMLGQAIKVAGCGRTDAGVHASQYFLHFRFAETLDFDPVFRLNKMLPADIVIFDCWPVAEKAHAQHDATSRTYEYFIHTRKSPFLEDRSSYYELGADFDWTSVQKAVSHLPQTQNYYAFCKRPDLYVHTLCKVTEAELRSNTDQTRLRFRIRANRFLQGMVRLLVGNLLKVGQGRLPLERFMEALQEQKSLPFFNAAYPQGLYLTKVEYPYLNLASPSLGHHLLDDQWGT